MATCDGTLVGRRQAAPGVITFAGHGKSKLGMGKEGLRSVSVVKTSLSGLWCRHNVFCNKFLDQNAIAVVLC